jgi:hypothetical protein
MNILKFSSLSLLSMGLTIVTLSAVPVLTSPVQAADIAYKPPVVGAPTRRVGAGSRGQCQQVSGINNHFALQVLAPPTLSYTSVEQPKLYWSVSQPVSGKFTVTVTEESKDFLDPILDQTMTLSVKPDIQTLSLADHQVSLKPQATYKWSVSLECDASNPSSNIVASGMIKFMPPAAAVKATLAQTPPEKVSYVYAENGYWYDAYNALSESIQSHPNDQTLLKLRASLLKQGGLEKVAKLP